MIAAIGKLTLNEWYYILGIGGLISGGALFFYRKALVPLYGYARAKVKRISDALDAIDAIKKEVFPNGSGSMRDSVDRSEKMVRKMAKNIFMSLAQNRSLFEQSETGMFEGDEEGELLWANRAFRQMTGMRLEQLDGSGWINAIHDDDRRRVENDWRLCTGQRRPMLSMFRVTHIGTGVTISVHCEAYPVFSDGGDCSGWLASIRTREVEV
jgi:PAS domain S-box-containing protein